MRIEKGHVTGNELNGTITAHNLGMAKMVSAKKDSIGAVLAGREALVAEDGLCLVGLEALDDGQVIAGSHLFDAEGPVDAAHDRGYVTSAAYSPHIGASIGLGFITRGADRHGEVVRALAFQHGKRCHHDITDLADAVAANGLVERDRAAKGGCRGQASHGDALPRGR